MLNGGEGYDQKEVIILYWRKSYNMTEPHNICEETKKSTPPPHMRKKNTVCQNITFHISNGLDSIFYRYVMYT